MKKHISITIDPEVLHIVRRMAVEEHRSVSQVIEMAVLSAAQRRFGAGPESSEGVLPVTDTYFSGTAERNDAYRGRI